MPSFDEIQNIFGYHAGTEDTIPKHETTRQLFLEFADRLNAILPEGRAKALAFTNLQQASMWSNYSIAETAPVLLATRQTQDLP